MYYLGLLLGARGHNPTPLALRPERSAIVTYTVSVVDGDRHDRRTNTVPDLALRISGGSFDASVNVLLYCQIRLRDKQSYRILGIRIRIAVVGPGSHEIDIGQADLSGQNFCGNVVIHEFCPPYFLSTTAEKSAAALLYSFLESCSFAKVGFPCGFTTNSPTSSANLFLPNVVSS